MILSIKNLSISFQKNLQKKTDKSIENLNLIDLNNQANNQQQRSLTQDDNHQEIKIIDNFNCNLYPKKITALIGQSGSGKSSIALSIVNLLNHAKISGEIIFNGQNLLKLSVDQITKIRGKDIGLIFQDANLALNPLHKIDHQIGEAITIHNPKISKKALNDQIDQLLEITELSSLKNRKNCYPHQLSGGQKQRVMIAIAIANKPKILIADEPTTALDFRVQNEILHLLKKIADQSNTAILLITHNRNAVKKIADQIIEIGNKIDYQAIDNQSKNYNFDNLFNVLEVKNLSIKTANKFLNNQINFSLKKNQNLGIIGESGSGKTSLAFALANLSRFNVKISGSIKFFNQYDWQKDLKLLRKKIQIIFQDPYASLNPRMMVRDIVCEGLVINNINKKIHQIELDNIFEKLHLSNDLQLRYPHQLSGGQRQRIAIARSLIIKPEILILDEPTSSLDYQTQNQIIKLLQEIQQFYPITYIIISHDLEVVESIANQVAIIANAKMIEFGDSKEVIAKYLQAN